MPIFYCQHNLFSQVRRVYPSRKTILNCFARQSTTCPNSVFKLLRYAAPRIKRHRSHSHRKLNVSAESCSTHTYFVRLCLCLACAHILFSNFCQNQYAYFHSTLQTIPKKSLNVNKYPLYFGIINTNDRHITDYCQHF